jgi:hypothetical protein
MEQPELARCPRCGGHYPADISTGSRNAVGRDVLICPTCGRLEAAREWALRRPPIPYDEWPVDPSELGDEYASLARGWQEGELATIATDELTPADEIESTDPRRSASHPLAQVENGECSRCSADLAGGSAYRDGEELVCADCITLGEQLEKARKLVESMLGDYQAAMDRAIPGWGQMGNQDKAAATDAIEGTPEGREADAAYDRLVEPSEVLAEIEAEVENRWPDA